MSTATGISGVPPKGFGFFCGLCLVLGLVGLAGNVLFLLMNISHGMSPKAREGLILIGLMALHLTRSAGYLAGWTMILKRMTWARPLIVACAATSLLELSYNTIASAVRGTLQPTPATAAYFLIPLIIEGSVFWYFSRRAVGEYLTSRAN